MRNADHEFELGAYGTCRRCGDAIHGLRSEIDAEDIRALLVTCEALGDRRLAALCVKALEGSTDAFSQCERTLRHVRSIAQESKP